MHAVDTHRSHHAGRSHSHHSHHHHHARPTLTPAHAQAVSFLAGIPLACDPGQAPPPLFPFVPFPQAVRAWLNAGGAGHEGVDGAEAAWEQRRREACVAFLGNIPMGTEAAAERPQPIINLPMGYFAQQHQQHQQQPLDDHRRIDYLQRVEAQRRIDHHPASSDALPPLHPDLALPSSSSGHGSTSSSSSSSSSSVLPPSSGVPLLVHASSLRAVPLDAGSRGSTGSGFSAATGEMLLYANGADVGEAAMAMGSASSISSQSTSPNHLTNAAMMMLAPLRIQTPPLLLGLASAGGAVAGANSHAVGANLFTNPLMFPSTLAPPGAATSFSSSALQPSEMRRAVTQQPTAAFHLPGVTLGRSLSERAAAAHAAGVSRFGGLVPSSTIIPGVSSRLPTNVPTREQQDEMATGTIHHATKPDDQSPGDLLASSAAPTKLAPTAGVPVGMSSAGATNLGGHQQQQQQQQQGGVLSDLSSSSHPSISPYLRSDGTGRGLHDQEALFIDMASLIAAKVAAAGPGGSGGGSLSTSAAVVQEEWEHHLLSRGLLDPRARRIYTSGCFSGASGPSGIGAPVMVSSLQPWIARESSSSSTSQTPTNGKSRTGSFSIMMDGMPNQHHHANGETPHRGMMHVSSAAAAAAAAAVTGARGFVGVHGKNPLLALAAAADAAHQAEEEGSGDSNDAGGLTSSSSRFDYGGGSANLFSSLGKRKGTSYGYLLPCSYAGRKAAKAKEKQMMLMMESGGGGGGSSGNVHGGIGGAGSDDGAHPADVVPSSSPGVASLLAASLHPSQVDTNDAYDPFFLDDPNIKSGKHRVVLNLPGFMSSLISYVRTKDLKLELNETFARRHEEWLLPASKMSLSKIRKCKQLLLDIGQELKLEISTVAVAYIYYEKLILANAVDKPNRKLMAAVCLLLAFKWTEGTTSKKSMQLLFQACEKVLDVSKAHVVKNEFPVYVQLAFNLAVKTEHVLHHFRQCLSKLDTVPQDYLHIEWSL